jgi:hypothetical protein
MTPPQRGRSSGGVTYRCMRWCPPWGFCATPVALNDLIDGCGGPHGRDGYVTRRQMEQEMREHGLAHLVERLHEIESEPS